MLVRRFLYVVFFVQVGLLLIVMPWWPPFWEHNYFAMTWPALRDGRPIDRRPEDAPERPSFATLL